MGGRALAALFYEGVVRALVGPQNHAAALIGFGSDVLGFDTERSTDHGWGPRLQIFVAEDDREFVSKAIERGLPETFRGLRTRFGWDAHPVTHHVDVAVLGSWLRGRLGCDPTGALTATDWLAMPQQRLAEVTGGPVFHDGRGDLTAVRDALEWYPPQVWIHLLACQWQRLAQEEAFVGRAAEVGDDLGSRLVAARLARDLIRLCFLVERRYAPYSKWLGSAFNRLVLAPTVGPSLEAALAADTFSDRERGLAAAYRSVADAHNALGLTDTVNPAPRQFHGRPYLVSAAEEMVAACKAAVTDSELSRLPLTGNADQLLDSTDALTEPAITFSLIQAVRG